MSPNSQNEIFRSSAERFIRFTIPASEGHRTCDSEALICFDTAVDMAKSLDLYKTKTISFDQLCRNAKATVFDPDLGLGDYGVDCNGDITSVPQGVRDRIDSVAKSGLFVMARRNVFPFNLTREAIDYMNEPYTRPREISWNHRHDSYVSILQNGKEVAVIDRNRMSFQNALLACLRGGIIDGIERTDQEAELAAYDYSTAPVDAERQFEEIPPKAPKRKAGTAPTNPYTIEQIHKFITILDLDEEDYPIPPLDTDAMKIVRALQKTYKERKAAKQLLPTDRQIAYAKTLAAERGIDLPADLTRASISDFISATRDMPTLEEIAEVEAQNQSYELELEPEDDTRSRHVLMSSSPYHTAFTCIHDETKANNEKLDGLHHSVFRYTQPDWSAATHTFTVIWDEDHDIRVFEAIDYLHRNDLLPPITAISEKEGSLTIYIPEDIAKQVSAQQLHRYLNEVEQAGSYVKGDWWSVYICLYSADFMRALDSAGTHNGETYDLEYVRKINVTWHLGMNEPSA